MNNHHCDWANSASRVNTCLGLISFLRIGQITPCKIQCIGWRSTLAAQNLSHSSQPVLSRAEFVVAIRQSLLHSTPLAFQRLFSFSR